MSKLSDLSAFRGGRRMDVVYFDRVELQRLLHVYGRHVASGAWRDYAIDHTRGMAVFSIYRSTHEQPIFIVLKYGTAMEPRGRYLALHGQRRLRQSSRLQTVLEAIERKTRKVIPLFS